MKCTFKRLALLAATVISAAALLSGCSGSDGANGVNGLNGADGATGATGATGPAGPVTTTNESCMVCHANGRIADISDAVTTGAHYNYKVALPQLAVTINSVTVTGAPATPVINTTFTPTAGSTLNLYADGITKTNSATQLKYLRFAYARMQDATSAATSPQWIRYSSGDRLPADLFDNGDGSYTMKTPVAAADYNASKPTRLLMLVGAATVGNIPSTTAAPVNETTQAVQIVYNFVPDGSAVTLSRDLVTEASCNGCHSQDTPGYRTAGLGHGGRYTLAACVVCHADRTYSAVAQGIDPTNGRVMTTLAHRIHAAKPSKTGVASDNWSEVTYPQAVTNCTTCHTGTANADNWKTKPTAVACGSCHDAVNFTTGVGHAGGIQPDANCSVCHPATGHININTGASVTEAHDFSPKSALHPNPMNVPEYTATLSMTAPANTTYYVAGEEPVVTVTLKNPDGTDVPASLYTSKLAAAGTHDLTKLSKAALYVYGPRADARPVLHKGAVTLSAAGAPGQSVSLLLPSTDTQVLTDSTGFKYKLSPITTETSGTYVARFIGNSYGRISDTDYVTDSNDMKLFQIGTATVEKKVAGDCSACHGTDNFAGHYARHGVKFDTDQCNGCHDRSGNHGDPIANRVHAIHAASVKGDLLGIDWAEITYPQSVGRCNTCHNSGATSYTKNVSEFSCIGCHGDATGAIDHIQQSGGQTFGH